MLGAQIGTDLAISLLWERLTTRASVAEQLTQAYMVYVVDVALAPVGLLAALAIDESPWYLTLMIPLFGVLAVFAAERRTRLEQLTELNGAYRGTALVLAEVVDADDAYTGQAHARRRRALDRGRRQLGLDDRHRRNVEFGALLHDVGKVAIPNEILNKPGPLRPRRVAGDAHAHDRGPADAGQRRRLHERGRRDRARIARALGRRRATRTAWPA